jgi:hypothetical protein
MIDWWFTAICGVSSGVIAGVSYALGRRQGRREGKAYQLAHPRPEDAVWVPSTRPKPVARSRAQVTRAAYVERESGEEVQPTRVKKARMKRRRRTF